jgi:hypothetical protein
MCGDYWGDFWRQKAYLEICSVWCNAGMVFEMAKAGRKGTTMNMPRSGRYALLVVSLVSVLALVIGVRIVSTSQPTTLTTMLAVRTIIRGCHTAQPVALIGTLRASLAADSDGHIGLKVEPSYDLIPMRQSLPGTVQPISVERDLTVIDDSALFHRPVAPRRVGTLVTRINLPC